MINFRNFNFKYFLIKCEPYYHKIQYSKVFKHDIAAAVFGVVIGAFVVYLSLNTLGSGSPDLSDLSIFFWYLFMVLKIIQYSINSFDNLNLYYLTFSFFSFMLYSILL